MKAGYSEIAVVLDRSGSMFSVADDTIGGFNRFLEDQKKLPGTAKLTLVQFNTSVNRLYEGVRIEDAIPLTRMTYIPQGGTSLLDAMGETINRLGDRLRGMKESDRPEKVIVVTMTDGEENSSSEFTREKIFQMISHQREVYKWDFIFLGANQDAIAVGKQYGIARDCTMTYASNAVGTHAVYGSVSATVGRVRAGMRCAFKEDDRQAQADAGANQP